MFHSKLHSVVWGKMKITNMKLHATTAAVSFDGLQSVTLCCCVDTETLHEYVAHTDNESKPV